MVKERPLRIVLMANDRQVDIYFAEETLDQRAIDRLIEGAGTVRYDTSTPMAWGCSLAAAYG